MHRSIARSIASARFSNPFLLREYSITRYTKQVNIFLQNFLSRNFWDALFHHLKAVTITLYFSL